MQNELICTTLYLYSRTYPLPQVRNQSAFFFSCSFTNSNTIYFKILPMFYSKKFLLSFCSASLLSALVRFSSFLFVVTSRATSTASSDMLPQIPISVQILQYQCLKHKSDSILFSFYAGGFGLYCKSCFFYG